MTRCPRETWEVRFLPYFFVDTPTVEESEEIIGIMNARYGTKIPAEFAQELFGWTGAEIEQLAKDSLFDGLEQARQTIVPLVRTMKEEIDTLKRWAATRARRANGTDRVESKKVRRIHSHVSHQ